VRFAERTARVSARDALAGKVVQAEVMDALQAQLLAAAPMALKVLESLASDPAVPAAVRRLAASDLLDRAGLVSQAAVNLGQPIESLSEMPAGQLRALVERLETELFARSKPVQALQFETPKAAPVAAKPLNILD